MRLFRRSPPPPLDLFDVHVNALPPGIAAPRGFYTAQDIAAVTDSGVSRALVGPPALAAYAAANAGMRDWAKRSDGRHLAVARLGGPGGPRPIAGLWQARAALRARTRRRPDDVDTLDGFAAVKLMPHVDGLPGAAMLAEIARRRLPVLIHAGAMCPPRWLERHLLPALNGPLILAHLGSWPCSAEALADAVGLAKRDERVYLETSGASIGNFIAHAAAAVPHKVLFGSNAPMCPPAVQWAHVAAAIRDDQALERIASGNAEALFGTLAARSVQSA